MNRHFSNDINRLCDVIRETSFAIHRYLRGGHLEKIYENALVHRLKKAGIDVEQQHPLEVRDEDGTLSGNFGAPRLQIKKYILNAETEN